jgi:hypothetical protein
VAQVTFVAPQAAPSGATFAVVASRFQRGEQVVTWLNTPSGVQGLSLAGTADEGGKVQLQFDSAGLAPGFYGLVLHGRDSGREHLLPFDVVG